MIKAAELYLIDKKISRETSWQIDAIAVDLDENGKMKNLRHIENAVY